MLVSHRSPTSFLSCIDLIGAKSSGAWTATARWLCLLVMTWETFYAVTRFDEFQYYVGIAPNILSNRLKKLTDAEIMKRGRSAEYSGRYDYLLTDKGRASFPTYLGLKKWGDDWWAEPEGPQVLFKDRASDRIIEYPEIRTPAGKPLRLEDVQVVAGSEAVPFNRRRFSAGPKGERKKRKS